MKYLIAIILLIIVITSCKKENSSGIDKACGTYKSGQQLYKGPESGCYYINGNGNKTYVEKEACNCN